MPLGGGGRSRARGRQRGAALLNPKAFSLRGDSQVEIEEKR